MGMSCTLFMDICPDLQMNTPRDASFHLNSAAASQFSSLTIELLIASANSQKSEKSQQRRTRSYYDGGKFKIERQTETGREGEPSEGQRGQGSKHMRGLVGEGDTVERGGTTNLTSMWETQKQHHPKAEPPSALTGSLSPSLCPFPKPQTGHCGQGARLRYGGTSSTCFPTPPSPQLLPGLGFSCLPPLHQEAGKAPGPARARSVLPRAPQTTPKWGLTEDRTSTRPRTQATLPPSLGEAWGNCQRSPKNTAIASAGRKPQQNGNPSALAPAHETHGLTLPTWSVASTAPASHPALRKSG